MLFRSYRTRIEVDKTSLKGYSQSEKSSKLSILASQHSSFLFALTVSAEVKDSATILARNIITRTLQYRCSLRVHPMRRRGDDVGENRRSGRRPAGIM